MSSILRDNLESRNNFLKKDVHISTGKVLASSDLDTDELVGSSRSFQNHFKLERYVPIGICPPLLSNESDIVCYKSGKMGEDMYATATPF